MKFEFITRTIGRRLITGFIAMLLLIALVGVMGVLGLNTIRITVEDQLSRDFQLQDLAGQAEAEKNEARQAEKDFLLRYEQLGLEDASAQYVTLVTTHAANLRDKLTGIEIIERQRGNTEAADRVLTITDMVNAYETGFVDVVTLLETRGLQDDGLIGIFGESVDALESLITEISDPWLTVLVLQMRRRETDYMLSNDLQLINQIDVLVDQFIAQLTETTLTDQQHRDARILAENYLATLQEVVAIDTQVGEGIVRYSDAADAVEPELELVVSNARGRFAEAESSVLSQARFLVIAIVLVIAVAIAAGFGFAFATARSISHPLSEVTRTAGEIAAGDLDRRVRVDSQDEIGLLARNFNSMAENLQDMVESERGRKRVLERTVSDYLIFVERVTSGDLAARLVTDQNDKVQGEINDELIRLAENLNTMAANLDQMVRRETESRKTLESTVTEYMSFVQQVTDGDLTNRLELDGDSIDDEETEDDLYRLGVNLNTMVKSLADMARQFRAAAASVSSAATEIQATTTQQLASATEQDVTVTETVATLEEVRTTVLQTSERAQAVTQSSQQSVEVSRAGQEAVADSMEGMVTIRQQVENIAENILMLSERTQQIGEIIDTVNALADQSKLLALNASIEAARAGEEGKGFAVVALEVRQLAEQSRAATARVRDILSEIQQATNTAVMVTEEGSKGAEAGMTLVQRAGETIYELAETLEEAAQASMQIAASTQQQTNGMDQLAQAMAQIKQATTQTAASTQQAEQSVRDLIETARQLEQAAARYQL